jgi:hypothetical protein
MERPSIFTILAEKTCVGHLLNRGRSGWEGFDADDRSCGTFVTLGEAAAAVLARLAARPQEVEQLNPEGEGDHG